MTDTERVQAVVEYGFTERQARFLVLVTPVSASNGSMPRSQASPMAARNATHFSTSW
jgi:hypothetical protein